MQDQSIEGYNVLMESIDFFTQRFHVDPILDKAYITVNDLLNVQAAALFVRSGNEFVLRKQKGYQIEKYSFRSNQKLDQLPLFHSGMIIKNFTTYFSKDIIELFKMKMVVPLINDTELIGFIVSSGSHGRDIPDKSTLFLVENTLKLINYSIENNQRFLDFQKINSDLDRKIFNLFVINQSTKALLSDIQFNNLFSLATDVFSEVTGSKITSFGIYDPLIKKIKITGYRNVNSFNGYYTELELRTTKYDSAKIVLHFKEDQKIIKSLFKNWEELKQLETEYIILIVKGEILGIVTISESVQGEKYNHAEFELIESLASTTYIAITNAMLFKEVNQQKEQTEKKFNALSTLNRLIHTISSCKSKEEIFTLMLQTLQIGYGVKQAFICMNNSNNEYEIVNSICNDLIGMNFNMPTELLIEGSEETFYDYQSGRAMLYFNNSSFRDMLGEITCLVLSPIKVADSILGNENPYGFLVVVNTKENLKEEEIMVIDTITKNISPIIYQMDLAEQYKSQISVNEKQEFTNALATKIEEKKEYEIDFYVYMKQLHPSPFKEVSLEALLKEIDFEQMNSDQVFIVNNYGFVISLYAKNTQSWKKFISPTSIDEIMINPFQK